MEAIKNLSHTMRLKTTEIHDKCANMILGVFRKYPKAAKYVATGVATFGSLYGNIAMGEVNDLSRLGLGLATVAGVVGVQHVANKLSKKPRSTDQLLSFVHEIKDFSQFALPRRTADEVFARTAPTGTKNLNKEPQGEASDTYPHRRADGE